MNMASRRIWSCVRAISLAALALALAACSRPVAQQETPPLETLHTATAAARCDRHDCVQESGVAAIAVEALPANAAPQGIDGSMVTYLYSANLKAAPLALQLASLPPARRVTPSFVEDRICLIAREVPKECTWMRP